MSTHWSATSIDARQPVLIHEFEGLRYRYWLRRYVAIPGPPLLDLRHQPGLVQKSRTIVFCCFNPSVATDVRDDPSLRRMLRFAADAGGTELFVVNLFTAIASHPDSLTIWYRDPVGQFADSAIRTADNICSDAGGIFIAAWGVPKGGAETRALFTKRVAEVLPMIRSPLHVLRLTKDGHPEHPLRLPAALRPQPWSR